MVMVMVMVMVVIPKGHELRKGDLRTRCAIEEPPYKPCYCGSTNIDTNHNVAD